MLARSGKYRAASLLRADGVVARTPVFQKRNPKTWLRVIQISAGDPDD
jgi:hypothetical protein